MTFDRITAAIERHRVAKLRFRAATDANGGDAPDDVSADMSDALALVELTAPSTVAGVAAKLRFMADDENSLLGSAAATMVLRRLASDLDRLLAA